MFVEKSAKISPGFCNTAAIPATVFVCSMSVKNAQDSRDRDAKGARRSRCVRTVRFTATATQGTGVVLNTQQNKDTAK